jgi:hypothetical protein
VRAAACPKRKKSAQQALAIPVDQNVINEVWLVHVAVDVKNFATFIKKKFKE